MAVAHDASSQFQKGAESASSDSGTHTPSGTPRGAVVLITRAGGGGSYLTSVTYGGVTMTKLGSGGVDTSGEPGNADIFFLGSGIPTGAQTVQWNSGSSFTNQVLTTVGTVTADTDTEVQDFEFKSESQTNPSIVLSYGGKTCYSWVCLFTGAGSVPGISSGWTVIGSQGAGAAQMTAARANAAGTSDLTATYTLNDDVAMGAVAISESASTRVPRHGATNHGGGHGVFAVARDAVRRGRIFVPRLWTPDPILT